MPSRQRSSSAEDAVIEDTKDTDSLMGHTLEIESPKKEKDSQQEEPSTEDGASLLAKGFFCFVGLQISYLTW